MDILKQQKNPQIFGWTFEKVSQHTDNMENNLLIYISNNNSAAVKTMIVIAVVKTKLQVIQENKPSIALIVLFIHFFLNKCICDIIIILKNPHFLGISILSQSLSFKGISMLSQSWSFKGISMLSQSLSFKTNCTSKSQFLEHM